MKLMKESEIERLYKDAYISHLVRQGFTDYMAEVEANRKILKKKGL